MAIPSEIIKTEKRLVKKIYQSFKGLATLLATSIEGGELENSLIIQLSFDKLVPAITSELKSLYNRSGRKIKAKLNLQTGLEYVVDQAVKYIEYKKYVMLWNSKLSITQTTKEHIAEVVAKGVWKWKSYNEIAEDVRMQADAGVLSKARSQLIAVREAGESYEEARLTTLKKHLQETGEKAEKIRDTVNDDKVTEQCRTNEAMGWIMEEELFKSGDNIAPRNTNPRCRCTTNYRII